MIAAQRKPAGALRPSCNPMIGRGRSRPLQLAFAMEGSRAGHTSPKARPALQPTGQVGRKLAKLVTGPAIVVASVILHCPATRETQRASP